MAALCHTRVAVVTGSNRGIGFEIVKLLCQQFDGDVLLTARSQESGHAAVSQLESEGLSPKFHELDITDHSSITNLARHLEKQYGGLDVLVNNAGVMFKSSSPITFAEQVKETMKINFWSTLAACKILFPLLRQHSRVVNVSSLLGSTALNKCSKDLKTRFTSGDIEMPELESLMKKFEDDVVAGTFLDSWPQTAYGVSKIGVTTMSVIQQRELDRQGRSDVIVNACCPGWCRTEMGGETATSSAQQGADTPVYLATLPPDVTSPRGQLLRNRKLKKWTRNSNAIE